MEILKQEDQWPERYAANQPSDRDPAGWSGLTPLPEEQYRLKKDEGEDKERRAYTGHGETESEIEAKHHHDPVGGDIHRMNGQDTGLYGEDESDLYDVYAKPSPGGRNGYDVLKPIEKGH